MSICLFAYRSSVRFLLPIIAFLFSAIAGISVAAWLDAPNAPPNYGLTPPYTQGDFRPMNLGATPQVKNAGVEFIGGVTASHFVDGNSPYFTDTTLPLYQLDLASSGEAGLVKGRLGVGATSTQAKLTVNNPATYNKWGSISDTIYAYADNTVYGMSAALSLEQGSPTGYAIYASGGINYFQGNVGIGTASPSQKLSFGSEFDQIRWPDALGVGGGIVGDDGNYKALTLFHGNSIRFDTGSNSPGFANERMRIDAAGNVGIGTASPQAKLEVGNGGSLRVSAGLILYNTDGPYSSCTAGAPTIPDPTGNSCTCKSGLKTLGQLGGSPTCTYNSFMSGGNNFASCVYSCTLSGPPVSTYKSADINLDGLGRPQISPSLGYTSTNFGGMYVGGCMNAGDENPYTGSCSCPAGFSARPLGGFNSITFCYR